MLDVIPEDGSFRANKKYPEYRLKFGNDSWRAYYHSHDSSHFPEEHGHFHVFFKIDASGSIEQDWSHVAALSMDRGGQPIQWFTVNNWVTGDRWLEAESLLEKISFTIDESGLVAYWLSSMLGFYQYIIRDLLKSRDRALESFRGTRKISDALIDREIYDLSHMPVALLRDMAIVLNQGTD